MQTDGFATVPRASVLMLLWRSGQKVPAKVSRDYLAGRLEAWAQHALVSRGYGRAPRGRC